MKPHYVVGLGEVLWDVLPGGKKLGGAPANFAFHVSGLGLDGIALSAVGRDGLGQETMRALDDKRLAYSLQLSDMPTSTVQVSLDGAGVPQYDIVEGVAWDDLKYDDAFARIASECACVCFGTLAQRSAASRSCIRAFLGAVPEGALKVFDINLRQNYYSEGGHTRVPVAGRRAQAQRRRGQDSRRHVRLPQPCARRRLPEAAGRRGAQVRHSDLRHRRKLRGLRRQGASTIPPWWRWSTPWAPAIHSRPHSAPRS